MLHFVVALQPEARPLIEHYGLQRELPAEAFKIFRRDDVALVVSGLGKAAAAAATAYLHLATGGLRNAAWLNVGIAGHGQRRVGEMILADEILDRASGACWQPPPVLGADCATDQVVTVDRVERRFRDGGAHEMEASGFYATALRFAVAELAQCCKIVSDGPAVAPESLSARRVAALIGENMDPLVRIAQELLSLSREVRRLAQDPPALRRFLEGLR
ncbi:MAG: hypothetical protein GY856_26120 [bacterium]|nr:hypothetical protein [bacterium]